MRAPLFPFRPPDQTLRGKENMKQLSIWGLTGALLLPLCALAQSWQPPTPAQRCPSKWGADDERGAANHMRPETVLRAARVIKTGEAIELGWVLSSDMP